VKLYTRTGDTGETSLFAQDRVSKADPRVDAYGEIDELNAWLGFIVAAKPDPDIERELQQIQRDLFAVGAQLADPSQKLGAHRWKAFIKDDDVVRLEQIIDRLDTEVPPLQHFILPGGSPAGAALHIARTVCRRAERRMVALATPVEPILITYINRLSDLLFAMARAVNHRAALPETEW
jgi:cob(I)alamin adenosyltransferase